MKPNNRLYSLDYLRGIAALGIMIYHLSWWIFGEVSPHSFLGKFGVYGVSIFYVLSGLTLYHVYFLKMQPSLSNLKDFFLKRFFRIYPLLWLVVILTVILNNIPFSFKGMVLNLTGLFGLVRWWSYYATGTWSIGNELVFYLFFPVFVFLSKKKPALFYILSLSILSIFLYFAFYRMDINVPLASQWRDYVNPLNQVFLFLSGYLIGYLSNNFNLAGKGAFVILLLSVLLFVFYPGEGNIGAGINRVLFSTSCIGICLSIYKSTFRFPGIIDRPLILLGEISYSVYLLHPIVWLVLKKYGAHVFLDLPPLLQMMLAAAVSLGLSYLVYVYFEKFFMKFGRSVLIRKDSRYANNNLEDNTSFIKKAI
jgi:peptidoglycan/LPS O-acetylase OafA/YrhL